jgi:hypothetical protein
MHPGSDGTVTVYPPSSLGSRMALRFIADLESTLTCERRPNKRQERTGAEHAFPGIPPAPAAQAQR